MSYDSYQPPPPGPSYLPPSHRNEHRPRDRFRDHDRDREHDNSSSSSWRNSSGPGATDSWRPDAYSGSGSGSGGSSRPSHSHPFASRPSDRDFYRPPPSFGASDNFRPPQGDFSFRVDRPVGIIDPPPELRRVSRPTGPSRPYLRGRGRGGPHPRFMASNRPILSSINNKATTQDFGKEETGARYRPLDELSDSDEAAMDISDDNHDDDDDDDDDNNNDDSGAEPSHKRRRLAAAADTPTSADEPPKWSNPDPYSVLPPTETQQKKKDVVQLIRKARVQTKADSKDESAASTDAAGPEDFISFDLDDTDGEDLNGNPTLNHTIAPTGSRGAARAQTDSQPNSSATDLNPARKRTHNDQLKLELPSHAKLKKVNKMPVGGIISAEWRIVRGEETCPWFKDHSGTPLPNSRLHKEIVDFYEHIKPRDYEQRLRSDLVDKLNRLIRQRFRDAKIYPFGSFMSGLYLPTGDMDLVLCSDPFLKGGRPRYNTKSQLWKFRDFLYANRLASEGEIEVISKARVPIVKYIDKATGLKVDISFENTTGVKAIQTFLDWKDQYPAMPVLVTLIKHFLTMRALNEPVNGGIGGFSIICLVVSMFQLMPQIQSRDMVPEHHLGEMLMHFFDLYGNKFNYVATAIRLNPPGYVPKSTVNTFIYKNPDRLSIIDPNNPSNDISGGSSNISAIAKVFSEAYRLLQDQMELAATDTGASSTSILKVILEGNYASFRLQRSYLQRLHEQTYGDGEA